MNNKLTLKQRKFWKEYQKTHSLILSAKAAGSKGKDNRSLSVIGYEILRSLNLQMPELLESKGLGRDRLSDVLESQLSSTKPLIATWEGKITDERLYPDNQARGKALELLSKMHGVLVDKTELTGRDGGDLVLEVVPASRRVKGSNLELDFDE